MTKHTGVLLVNTGSPDSPDVPDVRRYLGQFLMDGRLLVICPAFIADCLETLEEIGQAGRETFLAAGGQSFTLIPALNDQPYWVAALKQLVEAALGLYHVD